MFDLSNYDFTAVTDKTVKPEESFINAYVGECLKSESAISSTQRMRIILDSKYETAELNNVMTKQCRHLSTEEQERILALLQRFEYLFGGTLGAWNTTPVNLEVKDGVKPVYSRPYRFLRLHEAMFKNEV